MTTMKDVAKHAGVSVSTVSNIVNGVKTVNSEIVHKVELSMQVLGYKPNSRAQFLRRKKSNLFGVILPDITDSIHSAILTGIENSCKYTDYRTQVFTTADIEDFEIDAVKKLQEEQAEIIFVCSCFENADIYSEIIKEGTKVIFIRRRPKNLLNATFIGFDEYNAVCQTMSKFDKNSSVSLITLNSKYSNEKEITKAFCDSCKENGLKEFEKICVDMGKEETFKQVSNWIRLKKVPDIILTSNGVTAEGAKACLNFFGENETMVISLDNFSWTRSFDQNVNNIALDYFSLGIKAGNKGIDLVENSSNSSNENIIIPVTLNKKSKIKKFKSKTNCINILLVENSSSKALSMLAMKFERDYNVKINIDEVSTEQYYNLKTDNYDIIQIKPCHKKKLFAKEKIASLENTNIPVKLEKNFKEKIIDVYAKADGECVAIPYIVDTLLLLYKKDIFNSMYNKRLYFEKYKTELQPPKNYNEYRQIAEFFNNSQSCKHGTAYAMDDFSLVTSLITRIWEFSGKVTSSFEDIEESAIGYALDNLYQTYKLSGSEDFALSIMWQSAYKNILMDNKHKNLGQTYNISTLQGTYMPYDGWSLALTAKSKNAEVATEFLTWLVLNEITVPNNILGGSLSSMYSSNCSELYLMNVSLNTSHANLDNCYPLQKDVTMKDENDFNIAIANIVREFLETGEKTTAIEQIMHQINAIK